ncbi:MAG: tetratricopeptide repeat protein [Chitinophagaceae bacterium]|nr:tetratricopeptide repeat protein [Chitinophagaceae bacterium]MBP6416842.1 tetratricopeptide repeat protein [Chitinophagaceae bacterium]
MSQTRQLAAIMFTDISGFTSLMGDDEQKAYAILQKNRALQKPIIEQFNGTWIKELGDGVLASFPTVSDAMNAAFNIQQACNAAKIFQLSIGIHQGEIIVENGDIFGDAVNVASRIQSLGVPGSVLFSKKVKDEIHNKAEFQTLSLGNFEFKNVEEPLEIFALSNPGFIVPRKEEMKGKLKTPVKKSNKGRWIAASLGVLLLLSFFIFRQSIFPSKKTTIKSLAILPFVNTGNDSAIAYLSDGIPENLINRFSKIAGVKVFARSATFELPDSAKKIESLRRVLNADVVLTGRLSKSPTGYTLNCELVDAANKNQLWGNSFELTTDDIANVEDAIVAALLNPLEISSADGITINQDNKKVNPAAYAEYLKGRYLSYGSTPEESEKAISHFRKAISIDPKYALAYAAIANEKITQSIFSNAGNQEIMNEGRTSLEAAKALDPTLPEIYTTEGALKFYYEHDWKGAVNSYKKALDLDPNNAIIYIRYSATLADVGQTKEALPLADKAVELDPVSISSLHNLGWVNLLSGNYQKGIDAFAKSVELHPTFTWGYIKQAFGYNALKQYDKALEETNKAEALLKDGWGSELIQAALMYNYDAAGNKSKADSLANRFLDYASKNTVKDPYALSCVYRMKQDYKKALEWEEKTVQQRSPSAYILAMPFQYMGYEDFYKSEGHQKILRQMGAVQ